MIISYPFLPGPDDTADFAGLVDPDQGHYPIGFDLRWHGGVHLLGTAAPEGQDAATYRAPVRAVADGTLVAYRRPTARTDAEGHPLNYYRGWTDDGFVLLRHESATGNERPIVYYSLYMHLSELSHQRLATGTPGQVTRPAEATRIYRKEVLGRAGAIYGARNRIHFEIFTTDAELTRFWRDSATGDGDGDEQFWGDLHLVIPAGTNFLAAPGGAIGQRLTAARTQLPTQEEAAQAARQRLAAAPAAQQRTRRTELNRAEATVANTRRLLDAFPTEGAQAGTNATPVYVRAYYVNGDLHVQSYTEQVDGGRTTYPPLGEEIVLEGHGYALFEIARTLYPTCPSGGYELMRFGRVLGNDAHRAQAWLKVTFADGQAGFVDFAEARVRKLSNADFPFFRGWRRVEEAQGLHYADGICDAETLMHHVRAADSDHSGETSAEEWSAYFTAQRDLARALSYFVCRHPSEWNGDDNAARYARLREPGQPLSDPEAWQRFEAHLQALQFWTAAGLPAEPVWHFHPLRFIEHYRRCSWLTREEFVQVVPRQLYEGDGAISYAAIPYRTALNRLNDDVVLNSNKAMRKYLITTRDRQAHFLANGIQETIYLRRYSEGGGPTLRYAPWYGRGFLQLTWEDNYTTYFRFRGRDTSNAATVAVWRDQVESSMHDAFDSAGYYWAKNRGNMYADVVEANTTITYTGVRNAPPRPPTVYHNDRLERTARLVNTGDANSTIRCNGLVARRSVYLYAQMALLEVQFGSDGDIARYWPSDYTRQLP